MADLDVDESDAMGDDLSAANKKFKRLRSTRRDTIVMMAAAGDEEKAAKAAMGGSAKLAEEKAKEEARLTEMIFLRDLHFGFLPDDCEKEFAGCFKKLSTDAKFASKVLYKVLYKIY